MKTAAGYLQMTPTDLPSGIDDQYQREVRAPPRPEAGGCRLPSSFHESAQASCFGSVPVLHAQKGRMRQLNENCRQALAALVLFTACSEISARRGYGRSETRGSTCSSIQDEVQVPRQQQYPPA